MLVGQLQISDNQRVKNNLQREFAKIANAWEQAHAQI